MHTIFPETDSQLGFVTPKRELTLRSFLGKDVGFPCTSTLKVALCPQEGSVSVTD